MNDRTYLCSVCEQPVWESAPHEHEEILIPPTSPVEQKGPPTGWSKREQAAFYTRNDAIRDGRAMRFLSKGKMRTTDKA